MKTFYKQKQLTISTFLQQPKLIIIITITIKTHTSRCKSGVNIDYQRLMFHLSPLFIADVYLGFMIHILYIKGNANYTISKGYYKGLTFAVSSIRF